MWITLTARKRGGVGVGGGGGGRCDGEFFPNCHLHSTGILGETLLLTNDRK